MPRLFYIKHNEMMALITRALITRVNLSAHSGVWRVPVRTLFGHHTCVDRKLNVLTLLVEEYFPINAYFVISGFLRILQDNYILDVGNP